MIAELGPDRDAKARALGDAIAAVYRSADRAMRDLPIYNPALEVAAIGFRALGDAVLGVIVTPWFMNLVHVPADRGAETQGATVARAMPAGVMDFTVGVLDGFGGIESCSLASPMFGFVDQQIAVSTAHAALAAVLDPKFEVEPTPEAASQSSPPALDRRRFLRGALTERRP